jgi:hypothetical protein
VKQEAKSGGLVVPIDKDLMSVFAEHAGEGVGNAQATDYALPFIYLLQKLSPATDEIEGAEAGMFLNTVTRNVTEETTIIQVDYNKCYNEWIPRDDGGGFIASHKSLAEAEQNRQQGQNKKGNGPKTQIVETANHYVLELQPDGTWMQAILSLTSTKLKASRTLMSRIAQVTTDIPGKGLVQMPSFAKKYLVKPTGPHENEKGKFYAIEIVPIEGEEGWVADPAVVQQAIAFARSLKAGAKGADFNKLNDEVVEVELEDAEEKASGKKKF